MVLGMAVYNHQNWSLFLVAHRERLGMLATLWETVHLFVSLLYAGLKAACGLCGHFKFNARGDSCSPCPLWLIVEYYHDLDVIH